MDTLYKGTLLLNTPRQVNTTGKTKMVVLQNMPTSQNVSILTRNICRPIIVHKRTVIAERELVNPHPPPQIIHVTRPGPDGQPAHKVFLAETSMGMIPQAIPVCPHQHEYARSGIPKVINHNNKEQRPSNHGGSTRSLNIPHQNLQSGFTGRKTPCSMNVPLRVIMTNPIIHDAGAPPLAHVYTPGTSSNASPASMRLQTGHQESTSNTNKTQKDRNNKPSLKKDGGKFKRKECGSLNSKPSLKKDGGKFKRKECGSLNSNHNAESREESDGTLIEKLKEPTLPQPKIDTCNLCVKFIAELWMLANRDQPVCHWDDTGLVIIVDMVLFEINILRVCSKQYETMKGNFYKGFHDILTSYGFKQLQNNDDQIFTGLLLNEVFNNKPTLIAYLHPFFQRGRQNLISRIRKHDNRNKIARHDLNQFQQCKKSVGFSTAENTTVAHLENSLPHNSVPVTTVEKYESNDEESNIEELHYCSHLNHDGQKTDTHPEHKIFDSSSQLYMNALDGQNDSSDKNQTKGSSNKKLTTGSTKHFEDSGKSWSAMIPKFIQNESSQNIILIPHYVTKNGFIPVETPIQQDGSDDSCSPIPSKNMDIRKDNYADRYPRLLDIEGTADHTESIQYSSIKRDLESTSVDGLNNSSISVSDGLITIASLVSESSSEGTIDFNMINEEQHNPTSPEYHMINTAGSKTGLSMDTNDDPNRFSQDDEDEDNLPSTKSYSLVSSNSSQEIEIVVEPESTHILLEKAVQRLHDLGIIQTNTEASESNMSKPKIWAPLTIPQHVDPFVLIPQIEMQYS